MMIPDKYKVVSYESYINAPKVLSNDTIYGREPSEKMRKAFKDSTEVIFLVDSTNHQNIIVINRCPPLPVSEKVQQMLVEDFNRKGKIKRYANLQSSVIENSLHKIWYRPFNYIKINQRLTSDNGERYNSTYLISMDTVSVTINFNNLDNTDFEEYIKTIKVD